MPRGGKRILSEEAKQKLRENAKKARQAYLAKKAKNDEPSIPEGQPIREGNGEQIRSEASTDGGGESLGQSGLGQLGSRLSSFVEARNNEQGVLGDAVHSNGVGDSNQSSTQDHGDTHAKSPAGSSDQHPEQPSQQPNANRPNESDTVSRGQLERLYDPAIYCGLYCREPASWKYSERQLEFMRACRVVSPELKIHLGDFPRNIVLGAVNGVGKTQIIADLIRYFMDTIPGCGIGFSSHVARQCEALERYLDQHQLQPRYKDWKCVSGKLEHPNGNWARWFTAKDVGAVESLHANFMIRILDEVKSMKDEIIDATNRWQPKLTIFVSSKGLMSGRFYDCFTSLAPYWIPFEINAYECPWISQKWIDEQMATHGKDSALVKSMITNEFSDVDLRNLVNYEMFNEIIRHVPQWMNDNLIYAGLDVSAAKKDGDECVLFHRKGNKVETPWCCPSSDNEMEVVGRVMQRLREVKPNYLFIDKGGAGAPVAARIAEIIEAEKGKTQVIRTGFGDKAIDGQKYVRKNAELYGVLAKKIIDRTIILPDHEKLKSQLTSRQYTVNSQGQIVLESKDTMRRRGMKSPDYADALVLCIQEPPFNHAEFSKSQKWFQEDKINQLRKNNISGKFVGGRFLGNG